MITMDIVKHYGIMFLDYRLSAWSSPVPQICLGMWASSTKRLRVSQVGDLVFGSPIFDVLDFKTHAGHPWSFHTRLPDWFFSRCWNLKVLGYCYSTTACPVPNVFFFVSQLFVGRLTCWDHKSPAISRDEWLKSQACLVFYPSGFRLQLS